MLYVRFSIQSQREVWDWEHENSGTGTHTDLRSASLLVTAEARQARPGLKEECEVRRHTAASLSQVSSTHGLCTNMENYGEAGKVKRRGKKVRGVSRVVLRDPLRDEALWRKNQEERKKKKERRDFTDLIFLGLVRWGNVSQILDDFLCVFSLPRSWLPSVGKRANMNGRYIKCTMQRELRCQKVLLQSTSWQGT